MAYKHKTGKCRAIRIKGHRVGPSWRCMCFSRKGARFAKNSRCKRSGKKLVYY